MTKMTSKTKTQDKSKMCEIDDHILRLFEIKKRLGKGAYGIVWKAIDKRTEDIVAVKKIFDAFRDQTDAQRTFREIIFLNAFRSHPNIVKLHNVYRATNNLDIYLVFEYMESDLHNIIKRGSVLKDVHKRYVIYQLINAIKYIHSGNVIHRDLKPSNVLIDSRCRCKLADFGLARSVSNRDANVDDLSSEQLLTDYVATRWYRAPEILVASKRYTKGIDMWSLGCILGEMLRGKPLFQGNSTVNQIEHILCALPEITNHEIGAIGADFGSALLNKPISREKRTCLEEILGDVPSDAMDLVKSLLVFDPLSRLTAAQALEHPYVIKFRHTITELDLDVDILPPFSDDIRLTVPQYREKLYELVEDAPKVKANKSATTIQTKRAVITQRIIPKYEKRSNFKTKVPSSQQLEHKESRERLSTAKKNTSQEGMPIKKNSPQTKNVPIKTMMNTLPTTKTVNVKPEVMPNNEVNTEANHQRKPTRKLHKNRTMEPAITNSVDKSIEMKTTPESVQVTAQSRQVPVENVRSLIKKRVSSTANLTNLNHSQTLPAQTPTPQEQQSGLKTQTILQQQLHQHFLKQQQQQLTNKQQKIIKEQKIQQYLMLRQPTMSDRNMHKNMPPPPTQHQQRQTPDQNIHYHKNSNHHAINHESNSDFQPKISTPAHPSYQQHKQPLFEHQRPTDPPPTTDNIQNMRQRMNTEACKLKSQNGSRLHRETVNNNNDINANNNRDCLRGPDKRTKSAEYTINRQGVPTLAKETVEDVNCYEERLRRIEEEINCYKDEVRSYAYDNLLTSKSKLEKATKSSDRVLDETTKQRTTPLYKQNLNNNIQQQLYQHNKVVNRHFNYNTTSSSSHCSSESDVPPVRAKNSFTNFPTVYAKNSFYQFMQRQKNKQINHNVKNSVSETNTGGSGDHRHINRPLEIALHEFQDAQNSQQKLQIKRSVTNLIKAHLRPTQSKTTMQSSAELFSPPMATPIHHEKSMLFTTNTSDYRYKNCSSRRKASTKAF